MKRIKDIHLLVKLIFVGIFIITCIGISSTIKDETVIEAEIIPTITVAPTPLPAPTREPMTTPADVLTVTATPEPMKKVELPDVGDLAIQEALKRTEESLELFKVGEITLYNTYSEEELELLFRVVEAEATDYDVMCKSHVASVIFNRLKAGWWGGDLKKSLLAKRQFEVITNGRYKRMTITEETILACEIAFANDTAQGALFFDSTKGKSWAHENREYIFSDDAHWFYK